MKPKVTVQIYYTFNGDVYNIRMKVSSWNHPEHTYGPMVELSVDLVTTLKKMMNKLLNDYQVMNIK